MIVFIDDRPVRLTGPKVASRHRDTRHGGNHLEPFSDFDQIVDARLEVLKADALQGHLLVLNAAPPTVEKLVSLLQSSDISHLSSVTLFCIDKKAAEERMKSLFKVVKAAGGVVFKGDQMLLMFRRGVWDLPKGKLDDGESSKAGAIREVEEETGAVVDLDDKICTTWHTYTFNDNRILKRTKWYRMTCLDESHMAPQEEEDIEQLAWMDRKQAQLALTNSYSSIRYVIESVFEKEPKEDD
ncbi:hypothetical protein GCM10023189_60690 [Nibrella saemangeumensis]|uniref:Nudix hydrolase domain-containing protein n=1 Tax=Nibrella saemangeumensis TaxID=1084526 RepID=A0ABP8NQ16_9BACT